MKKHRVIRAILAAPALIPIAFIGALLYCFGNPKPKSNKIVLRKELNMKMGVMTTIMENTGSRMRG